ATADHQTFLLGSIDGLQAISPEIQGVLGQQFLSGFDFRLDLRNRRLEFGACLPDDRLPKTPFQLVNGRPAVVTSLGSMILDSGAQYLIRFGISGGGTTADLITSTGISSVTRVYSTLTIDGRTFWRADAIAVPRSPETGADGLLPTSPFKSVYFCN